jgi:hypothetical protein
MEARGRRHDAERDDRIRLLQRHRGHEHFGGRELLPRDPTDDAERISANPRRKTAILEPSAQRPARQRVERMLGVFFAATA